MATKSDVSSAAMPSKSQREKDTEEVHEIQEQLHRDRLVHRAAEVHENVVVSVYDEDEQEWESVDVGELHVVGGKVYVKVDGAFSADDALVFSQQVQKAFQAAQV